MTTREMVAKCRALAAEIDDLARSHPAANFDDIENAIDTLEAEVDGLKEAIADAMEEDEADEYEDEEEEEEDED